MIKNFTFILSITFFIQTVHSKELKFYKNGTLFKIMKQEELLRAFQSHNIEFYNRKDRRSQRYEAFKFTDLLNKVYGDAWKEMREISYICKNKFKPIRPISRLTKRKSFLAYKRKDLKNFVLIDKTSNNITDLSPYYLTWEEKKGMTKKEKAMDGWVYQIQGIDILDKTHPIEPNLPEAHPIYQGYKYVKEYCIHCHTINGYGGKISFDFNRPNIIKKNGRKGFENFIHRELINRRTRFNISVKDKKLAISQMANFLEYIGQSDYGKQRKRLNKIEKLNKLFKDNIKK
jgi:hypothetical protein